MIRKIRVGTIISSRGTGTLGRLIADMEVHMCIGEKEGGPRKTLWFV